MYIYMYIDVYVYSLFNNTNIVVIRNSGAALSFMSILTSQYIHYSELSICR